MLLNLISDDQLLVSDNVIIGRINYFIKHQAELKVPLQIDTLPCDVTADDILEALMQLLRWVSIDQHMLDKSFLFKLLAPHCHTNAVILHCIVLSICVGEVICKNEWSNK